MIQIGTLIDGRYRVLSLLGEGGMAEVWLARDERRDRPVAIKQLHGHYARRPELIERFRREAVLLATLDSPYIVKILDVPATADPPYIVMEHVDGIDLKASLAQHGPLAPDAAVELLREITAGVAAVHEAGLVHRDIKPGNVLISRSGHAKLTDFGLARGVAEGGQTEPGTVWGTSHYLSPEQARGEPATPASDVYALGALFFELLDGAPPFPGADPVAVAVAHISEPPPDLQARIPTLPRRLVRLLYRMLDKSPERRPANGSALLRDLDRYLDHLGRATIARPVVATGRISRQAATRWLRAPTLRWHPMFLLFAGAALLLVAAGLLLGDTPRPIVGNLALQPTAEAGTVATAPVATALPTATATPPLPTATPTVTPTPLPADLIRPQETNGPDALALQLAPGRSIRVDGSLSEWVAPTIPLQHPVKGAAAWEGLGDLSGQAAFAWDRRFLYVSVRRVDNEHLVSPEQQGYELYRGDAVELWIDADLAGDFGVEAANGDDFQFAFSPGDFASVRPEGVVYYPEPRERKRDNQLRVSAEPTASGYNLEIRIPWSMLGITPEEELVLGYALLLNDSDSPPAAEPQSQVGSNRRDPFLRPTTFGNLILVP